MHPKWRAPACYVGVAALCVLYLIVVPGVNLTTVCAGAGLGAAVMWAINEWETGKWNVAVTIQPAMAAAFAAPAPQFAAAGMAVATTEMTQVVALQAAPAQAAPVMAAAPLPPVAETTPPPAPALPEQEPRHRVDAGTATPDKMEKWEIDEKEPTWDPTALAETWAKLRAELSINRPGRPAVSPELPRTAQLARNAPAAPAKNVRPASAPAKPAMANTARLQAPPPASAKPVSYTLGSLGQSGGSPVLSRLASNQPAAAPVRKVAGAAAEPARPQGPSFLRPSTFRPR